MIPRSATRDLATSLSPVVGVGLTVAITLLAGIAVGFVAVAVVG